MAIQKILCVCLALSALAMGSATLYEVSYFGFPDGYVTDFQKAVSIPLTVLSWLLVLIPFLLLFFCLRRSKATGTVVPLLLTALVLLILATLFGVPWYFGSHLGLDNGIGG